MKKLLFPAAVLLYLNASFVAMMWLGAYPSGAVQLAAYFVVPVALAVGFFLIFETRLDDQRAAYFLAMAILLMAFVGIGKYATRAGDFVRFASGRGAIFEGPPSAVEGEPRLFYSLSPVLVKKPTDGHFGASYTTSTRKSTTTHAKHFAVPVFDADAPDAPPKVWLCASYTGGSSRIDDGSRGLYGFAETNLASAVGLTRVNAIGIASSECDAAVGDYLAKTGSPPVGEPLTARFVGDEPAAYFAKARRDYWILTILLNLLFPGVFVFALRPSEKV